MFNFNGANFGLRFVLADFQAKITDLVIESGSIGNYGGSLIENWNDCVWYLFLH